MRGMRSQWLAYPLLGSPLARIMAFFKESTAKELQASLKKLDQEDSARLYEKPQWKELLKVVARPPNGRSASQSTLFNLSIVLRSPYLILNGRVIFYVFFRLLLKPR